MCKNFSIEFYEKKSYGNFIKPAKMAKFTRLSQEASDSSKMANFTKFFPRDF